MVLFRFSQKYIATLAAIPPQYENQGYPEVEKYLLSDMDRKLKVSEPTYPAVFLSWSKPRALLGDILDITRKGRLDGEDTHNALLTDNAEAWELRQMKFKSAVIDVLHLKRGFVVRNENGKEKDEAGNPREAYAVMPMQGISPFTPKILWDAVVYCQQGKQMSAAAFLQRLEDEERFDDIVAEKDLRTYTFTKYHALYKDMFKKVISGKEELEIVPLGEKIRENPDWNDFDLLTWAQYDFHSKWYKGLGFQLAVKEVCKKRIQDADKMIMESAKQIEQKKVKYPCLKTCYEYEAKDLEMLDDMCDDVFKHPVITHDLPVAAAAADAAAAGAATADAAAADAAAADAACRRGNEPDC